MFLSKIFRHLFFSYIFLIVVSVIIYTTLALYENHQMLVLQNERAAETTLAETASLIDDRLDEARSLVNTMTYSQDVGRLYMTVRTGATMSAMGANNAINVLRNGIATSGMDLYGVVIFPNGSLNAYSAAGVASLPEEFQTQSAVYPVWTMDSVSDALGLKDAKRYSWQKECLLYIDNFRYRTSLGAGAVVVQISSEQLENAVLGALPDNSRVDLCQNDQVIWSCGTAPEGARTYERASSEDGRLKYVLYQSGNVGQQDWLFIGKLFGLILVLSGLFTFVAYRASRKYYEPIGSLEKLMEVPGRSGGDEMEEILDGIRNLIGEKNTYRDRILTIMPYAETGVFHSLVSGNSHDQKKLKILQENTGLNLVRSYYTTAEINVVRDPYGDAKAPERADSEEEIRQIKTSVENLCRERSSEDFLLISYARDAGNIYLIISYDTQQDLGPVMEQIHTDLTEALAKAGLVVTMGTGCEHDSIDDLRLACQEADEALSSLLKFGRGNIYTYEMLPAEPEGSYDIPVNFRDRLRSILEKGDTTGVHVLLYEIFKKNMDGDLPGSSYRQLMEEMHVLISKTLRDLCGPATTRLKIKRLHTSATLQETFDYYDAALLTVIDYLAGQVSQAEEDEQLGSTIMNYVKDNFTDPDLSLKSLSDRFDVSNKYLVQLFKKMTGTTYLGYLQKLRIEKACSMILENREPLSVIMESCGYTNALTFRRNFKAQTGKNPSEYGEIHGSGKI